MNISIDFVFNCCNLLVRIGLVIFIVHKYVIKKIQVALSYEKTARLLLVEQEAKLKQDCNNLENALHSQEMLYQELQNKFALWQQAVNKNNTDQQERFIQQQAFMQQQLEKKRMYVHRQFLIENELPALLKDSTQQLIVQFKDVKQGKAYITKVLQAVDE